MVDIIVVGYKAPEYELRTLSSIEKYTHAYEYHLTYYDNSITNKHLGIVWNDLIRKSEHDYICLLNNDVVVTPFWLSDMKDILLSSSQIGIVGPSTNSAASKQSLIARTAPLISPENLLTINDEDYLIEKIAAIYRANWRGAHENHPISGFCYLLRKSIWEKIGGFNEEFHHYGQENEFGYWVGQMGYRTVWTKGVYVHHWGAVSYKIALENGERDDVDEREIAKALYKDFTTGDRRAERIAMMNLNKKGGGR
jgi:GT2 family glycosyltransferase